MSNVECRSEIQKLGVFTFSFLIFHFLFVISSVFTSSLEIQHSIFVILEGIPYPQLKLPIQYSEIIEPAIVLIGI